MPIYLLSSPCLWTISQHLIIKYNDWVKHEQTSRTVISKTELPPPGMINFVNIFITPPKTFQFDLGVAGKEILTLSALYRSCQFLPLSDRTNYGSLSFARVALENFRTGDSNIQDDLSLTSDMKISCETTVQARCSKAASKLETCFPTLCLEPDDTELTVFNAKRQGTRPGWLHIGSHSSLGIHTPHQSTRVLPTSNIHQ